MLRQHIWTTVSFLSELLVWISGTWTSQACLSPYGAPQCGSRAGDLIAPWLKALYKLKYWVTLPGHTTLVCISWVRGRGTLSPSCRLAHKGQLEGTSKPGPEAGTSLPESGVDANPPAHQLACLHPGHTDSFPFQTGKPPVGIAGRK